MSYDKTHKLSYDITQFAYIVLCIEFAGCDERHGYYMRKKILFLILLLFVSGIAGCAKKDFILTVDEVTKNTLFAKVNGQLQVATVENFDKTYYQLGELEQFIAQEIEVYSRKAGEGKITIDEVELRDGKAILLLTYSGMDQYAAFNEVTAAYFNGGITEIPLDIPATLINSKNGSLASTQEIIQNNKFKILVMNEPYEIIVDGNVKYYSENVTLEDDNRVSASEGMSVVVFRP